MHLRTDWADLTNEQRSYGVYNRAVSKRWLLHACPNLTSWTEDDLVVSDSPGILKSARALGMQVGTAVTLQGRTHSSLKVGNTKGSQNTTEDVIASSVLLQVTIEFDDANSAGAAQITLDGSDESTLSSSLGVTVQATTLTTLIPLVPPASPGSPTSLPGQPLQLLHHCKLAPPCGGNSPCAP